jgi:hypothetical protein
MENFKEYEHCSLNPSVINQLPKFHSISQNFTFLLDIMGLRYAMRGKIAQGFSKTDSPTRRAFFPKTH